MNLNLLKLFLLTYILFCTNFNSYATIIVVPDDYATIQTAINASVNGDTIVVSSGTYTENINFRGKKIVVTSRFYDSGNLVYISNTIIDGSNPVFPDTASCVIFSSGEDSTTILQGFTLTSGKGTKWNDIHGAGLYREGGGILIELSSPTIQHNIITVNAAVNSTGLSGAGGVGIRIGDGNPKILNNIIMNNQGKYGPGIVLNYTGCVIKNNIIANNSGGNTFFGGGAIWSYSNLAGKQKIIENNTIVNNTTSTGTGGVLAWSTQLILRNNIIWGNSGAELLQQDGGSFVTSYCDVDGGAGGIGNINAAPLLSENFYLANNSPCIDAGDSSALYNDIEDSANIGFALYPSRGTLRNDIGAYGGSGSSVLTGTIIGVNERENIFPKKITLLQNYPNPFNPQTAIGFSLLALSNVALKIYNVLGQEVATLINNETIEAGTHEIQFDGSKFSSGVFYYELKVGNFAERKKMIVVK